MKNFKIKTMRCEWQVVIQQVDQYGASVNGRTLLDSWPTREEAIADLPNHGVKDKYLSDRWIPIGSLHRYEYLEIQYREVEVK